MQSKRNLGEKEVRGLIVFAVLFMVFVYVALRVIAATVDIIFLIALVTLFTLIFSPAVTWLERRGIPRYLSAFSLAILVLGVLALMGWLAYPAVRDQFSELASALPRYLQTIQRWLGKHASFLGIQSKKANISDIMSIFTSSKGTFGTSIGKVTHKALVAGAGALILFFATIYVLARPRSVVDALLLVVGSRHAQRTADVFSTLSLALRHWFYAVIIAMVIIFILTWIALGPILNVPFAFVFAFIAGLLEVIPTVGPILSAVPPVIVTLAINPMLAVWVIVAFVIIHQIENHFVAPFVLGRGAQIHPAAIIFAFASMAVMFGIIGAFLAVPTAITIRVLVEELWIKPRNRGMEVSALSEEVVRGRRQR